MKFKADTHTHTQTLSRRIERERVTKQDVVIWALYDDAECSYKKGIKKHLKNFKSVNIEVHSIGINDIQFHNKKSSKVDGNFFYHKIDLSLNNCNLVKELKKNI